MKCTTCSNEIPPGAKFCVHCGATVAASAAAAAAATAPAQARPAAPAAASATAARPAYAPPASSAPPPAGMTAMAHTGSPAAMPAAAVAPHAPSSRLGLIAGVLALLAIMGIGSFVAYKMFFARDGGPAFVGTEPAKATDGRAVQPAEASKDGSAAAGQGPGGQASNMTAPSGGPADAAKSGSAIDAAKAAAPVATPPAADAPAAAKAAASRSSAAAAKGDANKAPPVGSAPPVAPPMVAPAPVAPRAPAQAAVVPPPQGDRWEQMKQAYEVCNREGFFDKIACNGRVGKQYCEGYWGKVPQCPVGAYGDRSN
jgi:hypothetical protein